MADGLLNKASIILTPTGYKAGTLYNVAPVVEPYEDFDFARASVASRVNSSGLVEMVGRTLGSELVTNGDFATDSDWTLSSSANIANGKLNVSAGAFDFFARQTALINGNFYKMSIEVVVTSGSVLLYTGTQFATISSSGVYNYYFTSNSTLIRFRSSDSGFIGSIDNVSVKEIIDTNNIPRISYDSNGANGHILLEPTTTNLYLNTDTLSTQNVSTSASDYSVSFYGTGTITLSGSFSGSLVGTGVNNRVSLTFTATSGTLTSTVSGSVTNAQIENLGYSTSYMPSLSTQGVRATETATGAGSATLINSTEGVLYAEIAALTDDSSEKSIAIGSGSTNDRINIRLQNNIIRALVIANNSIVISSGNNITVSDITDINKIAFKYKTNDFSVYVNGVEEFSSSSGSTYTSGTLNSISFDYGASASFFYGKVKALAVFNEALSDSELTQLTT